MTWTRAAGTSHSTLTQGCGFGPTVKTQPATRYVSAMVATGMPDTMTRGLPGTVVTWPPCGQIIVSPTCRMGPGHRALPHVTVSAPALTVTVGPVITIVAPLPFEMVMPTSLMAIIAPVRVLSRMPPVGPGVSLSISVVWPPVCRTMLGRVGGARNARGGTSAIEPYQQPVQMG